MTQEERDEPVGSTELEKMGFVWDEPECMSRRMACGIQVIVTGDVSWSRRHNEGETSLSIYWPCAQPHVGGFKSGLSLAIRDNPTCGQVADLFDALGEPLT